MSHTWSEEPVPLCHLAPDQPPPTLTDGSACVPALPGPHAAATRSPHTCYRKPRPNNKARRILHTGSGLLPDKQHQRLQDLFAADTHVEVVATWGIYQRMITAYWDADRAQGKHPMQSLVLSPSTGVPATLTELKTLGRTLKRRAADVLAYFGRPGTSNGPTETINGRLEHLRGSALGFRDLTNFVAR